MGASSKLTLWLRERLILLLSGPGALLDTAAMAAESGAGASGIDCAVCYLRSSCQESKRAGMGARRSLKRLLLVPAGLAPAEPPCSQSGLRKQELLLLVELLLPLLL